MLVQFSSINLIELKNPPFSLPPSQSQAVFGKSGSSSVMPRVVKISKVLLLILGVTFIISFITLPITYTLIIFSSVLIYFSWFWYKNNYGTLDIRRFRKPLLFEKILSPYRSYRGNPVADHVNSNMGNVASSPYSNKSSNTAVRARKIESRSLLSGKHDNSTLSMDDSFRGPSSQRKFKSVQTAAGPLLYQSNFDNDSYTDHNSSLLRDSTLLMRKTFDNRSNYTTGRGYLLDSNRSAVAARRHYPTHQPSYGFLGQFPTVHLNNKSSTPTINLNNSLNQSRVTVKLAPPQVLTQSQRLNLSMSFSPSKTSPKKQQNIMEPNPLDSQTVLAALKDTRKRARKEKDITAESEAKRRRQEPDSDSSDSSIIITTTTSATQKNQDTNGDILMKTLQGKRPATPLSFYNTQINQNSTKRYKNDILTVSYSSSKKFFKEDALLILPSNSNRKRQASNFSPVEANKISKTKDGDGDVTEIDLTDSSETRVNEVELNKTNDHEPDEVEDPKQCEERQVASPTLKEGQSHKRNLACYAELGKSGNNVYNIPEYIPTLSDCEEHKRIEEDRVRRLLGTPLMSKTKTIPMISTESNISSSSTFQPIISLSATSPFSSTSNSIKERSSSGSNNDKPESSLPPTATGFVFGKPLVVPTTSVVENVAVSSNSSFISTGVNNNKSEASLLAKDEASKASLSKEVVNVTQSQKDSNSLSKTDKGSAAFLNCFQANVGKEVVSTTASTTSFTEAFKFSSSSPSLTTVAAATPKPLFTAASQPNLTLNSPPKTTYPLGGASFAKSVNSTTTDTIPSQINNDKEKNSDSVSPGVSTGIASAAITTSNSTGFSSVNPVFSFGTQNTTEKPQEKPVENSTATSNSGLFAFASTVSSTNPSNSFQITNVTTTSKSLTTNEVSKPQFSLTTSTSSPFQLTSSQPANTNIVNPLFEFSNPPTSQPNTTASSSTPSPFQFSSEIPQTTSSTSTSSSLFSFGTKNNDAAPLTTTTTSQPSTFLSTTQDNNASVKNPAFGSGGPLPSYAEATSTLGQATVAQTSGGIFGSTVTPSVSFGTQQATTVPSSNNTQSFANGFGSSSQTNAFGSSTQLNFGSSSTNPSPNLFGGSDANKNAISNFSFGTNNQQSAFGNPTSTANNAFGTTQSSVNAFGSTQAQQTNTFRSTQSLANAFGSTQPSTTAFGSTQPSTVTFGSAQPSTGAFGSNQPSTGAFGSAQPTAGAFGSAQPTTGTFGSAQPTTGAFGSAQPTTGAFGSAQPTTGAFGSAQPTTGAFGSAQPTTGAFGSAQPTTGAFGSAQPTTGAFGSAQPTTGAFGIAQPSTGGFGSTQPSTGAFGSAQPTTGAFGSAQPTTGAFGNAQPTTGAFGNAQPTTGAFGSAQPTTGAFGSAQPTTGAFGSAQPTTGAFGNAQPTTGAFGSAQPTLRAFGTTQPSMNAFGSSQPLSNPFGSSQPSVNAFGSTQPSSTTFGSTLQTTTSFGGTQPTASAFGSTQPSATTFGSAQPTANAFKFNLTSKNFNFGSTPAPEQPSFGSAQPLSQPYVFGGGQPTLPAADPNAPPGSQLFSIGSGVRDKRVATARRRPRK